ncbi:MAG: APC family permease [Gammaproteobacteria bacterium]
MRQRLARRFNPLHLLLLSINGMVGSAWLFAPLYSAKIAGSGAILAWVIGGVATILIALSFAELSVMVPVAGGSTCIPKISHGQFSSFMMGWLAWLSSLTMAPIEVLAVLQYASTYFPSLVHFVNQVPVLTAWGLLWAALLMLLMCFINGYSFKGLIGTNMVIFGYKILVIILIITMLPTEAFHSQNFAGFGHIVESATGWHSILSAVALGGIAFAFTGFKHGVELAGEAQRKKVTIPIAIIGSVLCCLLLYIGLQIVFIGALHPALLHNGWQALAFTDDAGPFAGILLALGITWLLKLLYVDAAVSPMGAGLIYMTSTARIAYAMAENGYFPAFIANTNLQQLPIAAIGLNFVIGMFLFLPFPGWQAMVGFLVSVMVLAYAMGPLSLLAMRKQMPDAVRAFRLPFAPVICPLAFYCCVLVSYWTGWQTISKLAIVSFLGVLVFLIAYLRGTVAKTHLGLKSLVWFVPFIGGLTLISYLGAFGGKNIIPFGWDFAALAVFSIIVLLLASHARLLNSDAAEVIADVLEQA